MVPRRWARPFLFVLLVSYPSAARAVVNCSTVPATDCTTTACAADCTEAALRNAVANANACAGVSTFQRTITFAFPGCDGCTINMAQALGSTATCADDSVREGGGAVCITGHDITIDGQNAVLFNYSGDVPCVSCPMAFRPPPNGSPESALCRGHNPGLFTVRGHHNTVKNFTMQYFPEGIIIRNESSVAAHDNTVAGVKSTAVCNKGITIDSFGSGGSGHNVSSNQLTGKTTAGSGHTCYEEVGCFQDNQCASFACYGNTASGTCGCVDDTECHAGQRCRCQDGGFAPTGNCSTSARGTCYRPSTCGRRGIVAEEGEALIGGSAATDGNAIATFEEPIVLENGEYEARRNVINGLQTGCSSYPGSCSSSQSCAFSSRFGIKVRTADAALVDNTIEYCLDGIDASGNPSPLIVDGNLLRFNYSTALTAWAQVDAEGNRFKANGCATQFSTGSPYRRGTVSAAHASAVIDFGGGALSSTGGNSFCGDSAIFDANNLVGATVTMTNNCFDDTPPPTPNLLGTVTTSPTSSCTASGFASCANF